MEPDILGMLLGAIPGLVGQAEGQKLNQQQLDLLRQAMANYQNLQTPDASQLDVEQGPTELAGVHDNPNLVGDQQQALASLMERAAKGGMTLQDQATLNQAMDKVGQQERAGREGIEANAAARGVQGGGTELASQLEGQQGGAQRENEAGLNVAANAQERALRSMMEGGRLAGEIRGQDYAEKSRAAEAQDAINRFNVQTRAGARQMAFQDAAQKAAGVAGATGPVAGWYGDQAGRVRNLGAGLGQAAYGMGKYGSQGWSSGDSSGGGSSPQGSDPSQWAPYPDTSTYLNGKLQDEDPNNPNGWS